MTFLLSLLFSTPATAGREVLAAPEPRTVLRVLDLDVAVHDSDPAGTRPALVCLHAVGHGGGDFAPLAALAPKYRLVMVDWPDHGASGPDPHPTSAARYAEVLAAVLDALDLDRFVLLGNSIGGAAAIRYAASRPERVRGLVLANPGGLDPGGLLARWYIGTLSRRFRRGADGAPGFPAWYARYYGGILVTPEAAARRAQIVAAGPEMARTLAEAWESFARPEADLREMLPSLTMPALVAWADRDRLVRWSRNRAALRRLPDARVVHFDAGHSPFLETPGPFRAELERFLDALP